MRNPSNLCVAVALVAVLTIGAASADAAPREAEIFHRQLKNSTTGSEKVLAAVALNASAATRTSEALNVAGFSSLHVVVDYTHGSGNVTYVTLTCSGGPSAAILGQLQSLKESATQGTWDGAALILRQAVSASAALRFVLTGLNEKFATCTVGAAGAPGGADVFDLYVRAGVL